MTKNDFDLVVIGAGSGGLTACGFARSLGAKVALIEKHRIGGDCTWTGCVPSKALLKAAKIAHETRHAARFGVLCGEASVDWPGVRGYVRGAIESVYAHETPDVIASRGVEVVIGEARFLDARSISASGRTIRAENFLITTGAKPFLPPIPGLDRIDVLTYEQIFDLEKLPEKLVVIGGGPIGCEMAQAFRRFGCAVAVVDVGLIPKDDPDAQQVIAKVFEREGIRFVRGLVDRVEKDRIHVGATAIDFDRVLVAVGRVPNTSGLDLEKAGVSYSKKGIATDAKLRTNVKHIYAAGDVIGGLQFTHLAGWQAFQAVRNALLPGASPGKPELVPWVTFTDPEVAQAGLLEDAARKQYGAIKVVKRGLDKIDRAVCEDDRDGFLKLVLRADGTLLGATIVAARAGEMISELAVAIDRGWKIWDLARTIHPYPTYSTALMQAAADAVNDASWMKWVRRFAATSG